MLCAEGKRKNDQYTIKVFPMGDYTQIFSFYPSWIEAAILVPISHQITVPPIAQHGPPPVSFIYYPY